MFDSTVCVCVCVCLFVCVFECFCVCAMDAIPSNHSVGVLLSNEKIEYLWKLAPDKSCIMFDNSWYWLSLGDRNWTFFFIFIDENSLICCLCMSSYISFFIQKYWTKWYMSMFHFSIIYVSSVQPNWALFFCLSQSCSTNVPSTKG